MDNVACFGSEERLIDCSYHSDTSEDDHSVDVRVQYAQENETSTTETSESETSTMDTAKLGSSIFISVVSLIVELIVCVLVVVLGAVYIVHRRQKYQDHPCNTERVECQTYSNSATEDGEVTSGKSGSSPQSRYCHPHEPVQPLNDQSHSAYQPLKGFEQLVQGPYETIRHNDEKSSSGKNQSSGGRSNPGNKHATPQELIYENT